MEKFNIVNRSCGTRNLPINIFIYLIFAHHHLKKKKKLYNNINIWGYRHKGGYLCKHSRARPTAIGRVGEVEIAKYNLKRAVPIKQSIVGTDLYPNIIYYVEGAQRLKKAPVKIGERSQRR